jgi:hypothetical protein
MSPLLTTLTLIDLCQYPTTMEDLANTLEISPRQVARHIEEARHLGAQLESRLDWLGEQRRYAWVLTNGAEIRKAGRLTRWLELEQSRTVV